ncbi:MAG: ribosomal-processing cysteine protease Prp [Selenomonadaceae bacterium]|nr:ribosomal-processing cysteine protease Prp [Selenomonadaceae bacterium]MBQ7722745.1 ribosomal-processing cysteine protease Prp [Selenomonadaceae bacterium]
MIVAEMYKQGDGKFIGFSINGHANMGGQGFDIYCAGASMMSQSTFLCIRDHLKRDFIWDAAHGRLMMRLKTPPDDLTEVAFQTMLIGMRELEKLSPQAVKVEEKFFLGD